MQHPKARHSSSRFRDADMHQMHYYQCTICVIIFGCRWRFSKTSNTLNGDEELTVKTYFNEEMEAKSSDLPNLKDEMEARISDLPNLKHESYSKYD